MGTLSPLRLGGGPIKSVGFYRSADAGRAKFVNVDGWYRFEACGPAGVNNLFYRPFID
jgi:hypothetical protein